MNDLFPGAAPFTAAALSAMLAAAGLSLPDNKWSLYKAADATAIQVHSLAAYSPATTRTITWQDASGTVPFLGTAQTWSATQTFTANVTQTGAGTFTSGTGTNLLGGDTTIASGKLFGLGSTSAAAAFLINTNAGVTATGARAIYVNNFSFAATTLVSGTGVDVSLTTVDAVFTLPLMRGVNVGVIAKGASATVTGAEAFHAAIQTVAASHNVGFHYGNGTPVAGTWGFYSSAASSNYFGTGATLINTTTNDGVNKLQVVGSMLATVSANIGALAAAQVQNTAGRFIIGSSATDATNKTGYYLSAHYTNAEEPFGALLTTSNSTDNLAIIGGGSGSYNAATQILFYTGATITTLTGTARGVINATGQYGIGATTFVGSEKLRISSGSAAAATAGDVTVGGGVLDFGVSLRYRGTQVVGARDTGWTAQTAGASKADLGAAPTVGALASFCRSLYDALAGHGLIGT